MFHSTHANFSHGPYNWLLWTFFTGVSLPQSCELLEDRSQVWCVSKSPVPSDTAWRQEPSLIYLCVPSNTPRTGQTTPGVLYSSLHQGFWTTRAMSPWNDSDGSKTKNPHVTWQSWRRTCRGVTTKLELFPWLRGLESQADGSGLNKRSLLTTGVAQRVSNTIGFSYSQPCN